MCKPMSFLRVLSAMPGVVLHWWGAVSIDPPAVQPSLTKAMGRCVGTTTTQHTRAQIASKQLLPQTCFLG